MGGKAMQHVLTDYCGRMGAATSFQEIWDCLVDGVYSIGFNVVNYTVFPDTRSHENPEFIENFKGNWVAHYRQQDYEKDDAMIPHVLTSDTPALMFAIDERQPLEWSDKGKRLIAEARDAGMERAIGFSHKNSDGVIDGGIGIGTDMMSAHEFRQAVRTQSGLLYAMYSVAYQKLHPERRKAIAIKTLKLSPRQYDLLMALWDGLSNKQIAHRLRVSEVTVSFHLGQLRQKLRCCSNREILPKAYHYGLLGMTPRFR